MRSGDFIDRLKLTAAQNRKLVEVLDAKAPPLQGSDKRQAPRYPYLVPTGVSVQVQHPGGTQTRYLIRPRNISETGLAFFHARFMHKRTLCRFALKTRADELLTMTGQVVHCRHVVGEIHEVGACFHTPLDVRPFIENHPDHDDTPRRPKLLCIDAASGTVAVLRLVAEDAGIDVEHTIDALQGIDLATAEPFDLILLGDEIESMAVDELWEVLADEGHADQMARWTALPDDVEPGVATMTKPASIEQLRSLLSRNEQSEANDGADHFVLSELWSHEAMRPIILNYLESLEEQALRLQHHLDQNEHEALRPLLIEMIGSAGSHGYPGIGNAAQAALEAVKRSDAAAVQEATQSLLGRCREASGFRATVEYQRAG